VKPTFSRPSYSSKSAAVSPRTGSPSRTTCTGTSTTTTCVLSTNVCAAAVPDSRTAPAIRTAIRRSRIHGDGILILQ
jgi:hypothetical protein